VKSESEVQQLIQLAGPPKSILMRNNSGAFTDGEGRVVRYGLGNVSKRQNFLSKSSDLIGITMLTVTPQDVGRILGVFTAVECKTEGWKFRPNDTRERAQANFIEFVLRHGGFAGLAASVDNSKEIIGL